MCSKDLCRKQLLMCFDLKLEALVETNITQVGVLGPQIVYIQNLLRVHSRDLDLLDAVNKASLPEQEVFIEDLKGHFGHWGIVPVVHMHPFLVEAQFMSPV